MENEVYEKDYGEEFRERSDKAKGKDFLHTLMDVGFFQAYKEEMDKIPKRVVPKEKQIMNTYLGSESICQQRLAGAFFAQIWYAVSSISTWRYRHGRTAEFIDL